MKAEGADLQTSVNTTDFEIFDTTLVHISSVINIQSNSLLYEAH